MKRLLAVSSLVLGSALGAAPLPIEAFFASPAIRQVRLSPDGTKLAVLSPVDDRYSISVVDLATNEAKVVLRLKDENVRDVFWEGNDRLMFYALVSGYEVPLLASTDLKGKMRRLLEPKNSRDNFSIYWGSFVDELPMPKDDGFFLLYGFTDKYDGRGDPGNVWAALPTPFIYRVNAATGNRQRMTSFENNYSVSGIDNDGQVRFVYEFLGGEAALRYRPVNNSVWQDLRRFPAMEIGWNFIGFFADNRQVAVIDYTRSSRGELRIFDTGTLQMKPEVLFTPPAGEIKQVLFTPDRQHIVGVEYLDDRRRWHWFDPSWQKLDTLMAGTFPGKMVDLVDISRSQTRLLFRVSSDRDPGAYYLLDLAGGGLRPLGASMPSIEEGKMRPMLPVSFTARDGLEIHGYLTLPEGPAGTRWPLVINPHGGPFGIRDEWHFVDEVQFLANRGYAVFQVNYRGSGGYGDDFQRAGYREWGGKMQDDLTDAVRWAVDQGYADPQRVAIYGASYGGYAALAGVTFTPELYRCAINYVGVSDLGLITRWGHWKGVATENFYDQAVGRDRAQLAARSPVNFVERIRVPTLHAYGENDPRVEIDNWDRLQAQLKKHKKPYEFIRNRNEGHGFDKTETRVEFYSKLIDFLDRNMAPR